MMRSLLLWCSRNRWMNERLPEYAFVRRAVSRFMPGEEAASALDESVRLNDKRIFTVLTLLGENVTAREEAAEVCAHYHSVLGQVEEQGLNSEVSVKLTQLGLDLDPQIAREALSSLVSRAAELGKFVWVDMEGSGYVDTTLQMFEHVRRAHTNVGVCLQAYLYRTREDLARLLPLSPAIRLVKGAYAEPVDRAYPKKKDVDENYMELAVVLLEASVPRAAFATHDAEIIRSVQAAAAERRIESSALEFQMLYGIARAKQEELAHQGHRMGVLISYGSAWFAWYMRRLAERPANLGFLMRSMFR